MEQFSGQIESFCLLVRTCLFGTRTRWELSLQSLKELNIELVEEKAMGKQLEMELVIFDMDGLMFDTEKISFIAWEEAARSFNYLIDRDIFEKTVGANLHKTKDIYMAHFGESFPFDLIVNERIKISDEIIKSKGVPIKKGLLELINYLNAKNIKMAVATSTSRKRALDLLNRAQIYDAFDYVLCGDEIKNSKPDPEIFLKVADKLQISPEKCVVLEDSEAGIVAAYDAGMIPIMIPDMKDPSEKVSHMLFKRMNHLLEVKMYFEDVLAID
jgi:HAD superfamily hydrolase (TIGR01509 family)